MAKISCIIFGIFVVSCSANFGFDRRENFFQRNDNPFKRATQNILNSFGVNPTDHRCFTLARRMFYMTRLVNYPCSRRQQDVPVLRWFMSFRKYNNKKRPQGPVCVSYFREPVYRYFRIPMCCPGFTMDQDGKCSIRANQMRQTSGGNNGDMMSMASQMRQAMWMRAKQDMKRRRAMFLMQMRERMQNNKMINKPMMMAPMPPMPQMQLRRPPMNPMFNMYNREQPMVNMYNREQPMFNMNNGEQMRNQPRVAFLRIPRPSLPMPHPVQQPPVNGRLIKIIKRKFIPLIPFMRGPGFPTPENGMRPPFVPRAVLSVRTSVTPMTGMQEFHPSMPSFPPQIAAPRIQFSPFMNTPDYPQESFTQSPQEEQGTTDFQPDGFHGHHGHHHEPDFHVPHPKELQMTSDNVMQVDLPNEPVQMPDLVVEQAPTNLNQNSCIVRLEGAVKTCLKQNNIDVPDVMSAFEPFNDGKSRVLCAAEDAIFNCISDAVKDCTDTNDADIAREMLLETAQTVRSMCDLRQSNMDGVATLPQSAERQDVTNTQSADTVASVENVDAIPTDVKAAPTPKGGKEEITIIETNPAGAAASMEAVKEAIQTEELRMKEYLLPILVGAGVGFMVLVLILSLMICCCCKRKLHKKMKMSKELEKPPLSDAIYTIGLPPPKYETNGIPPIYYEEAKGEKITSRSPAVLEGSDQAHAPEGTQM